MSRVLIYSARTLEPWNWTTPYITGIGGSETSHIKMVEGLSKLPRHTVTSIAPIGAAFVESIWHGRSVWHDVASTYTIPPTAPYSVFVYRDPTVFDPGGLASKMHPKSRFNFVAQDVDYDWTPDRLARVDRYLCLCQKHASYTRQKYPSVADRVYVTSNAIDVPAVVAAEMTNVPGNRNPHRIMYASSPDRGLLLILQDWFRIRERVPDAELHVFYGFNNMEAIESLSGGSAHFSPMKAEIQGFLHQPGITNHGRVNQHTLYEEWFKSGIWYYPTDWPETSCITCMEAQACGATPVTNRFWAVGQNVYHGVLLDGIPQKSPQVRSYLLHALYRLLEIPQPDDERREMMVDARETFNYPKIVNQWDAWIAQDEQSWL